MDDIQVCSNWEDIADNSTALDQQLERLRLEKCNRSSGVGGDEPRIRILTRNKAEQGDSKGNNDTRESIQQQSSIVLDSTREESQRSQYVPPEPRIKLLARPKSNSAGSMNGSSSKSKSQQQPVKTLEQREKEYREARMRILGDVQFSDPEEENDGLSPAEVLKQKIAEAMKPGAEEEDRKSGEGSSGESGENGTVAPITKSKKKTRAKKSREKLKTPNIESPREFPLSKTDSERILRQPRGPDGTSGFNR